MWRYELHPSHLISVVHYVVKVETVECNVTVVCITKENCIKHIVYASSKWTCRLKNLRCYATICVRKKDLWHLWPAKMLGANLGWLWTERYRGCDWPVARQSEIIYACWWRTLWTHAAKLLFICIIWFIIPSTCCSFLNLTVKTALKFVNILRSFRQKTKLAPFFMAHGIVRCVENIGAMWRNVN